MAPPPPVIQQTPASILIKSGEVARLHCYHGDDSYPYMLWYQSAAGGRQTMDLIGLLHYENQNREKGFENRFNMTGHSKADPSHSAVYFCAASTHLSEAYFGSGTRLTVLEAGKNITLPIVKIIQPSANECREQKSQKGKRRKTLVCVASDFYPDHVSVFWELNKQSITDGVATDPAAKMDAATGNYTITSRLRVLAKHWFEPQNKFKCIVRFFDGKNNTDHSVTVSCKLI
uniref:Ig-like domain-containing protein n=1 Tax=Fundulus heteroclitus TaxID=8078 RepID=A0A3Q2QIJ0_FUNHE